MRLSVIGPTYPYKGGISHFTTLLVENLRKKNDVDLISWERQYPSFLYPVELKDTQSKEPIQTEAKFILDFFNPFTWLKAFFEIRKYNTDLLLLTWASPVQAPIYFFISFLVRHFSRTKIGYICHNVLPHERAFYDLLFLKLAFSQAHSFIVHSKDDENILRGIVNNKKIVRGFLPIFNMFPSRRYDLKELRSKLALRKRVLLFFGYIRPYKGLEDLLKAMPSILRDFPDTTLLVVGEFWSKNKPEYISLVKKLKIEKYVVFIDSYVPNEELGKYFLVSDIVVLPYVTATQSAAIQTAFAFNKPVISTLVGGLKDVVEDGKTGLIIKPKDPDDIADKVKKYYRKPIPLQTLKNILKKFSWDKYSDFIYDALYD